MEDGFVEETLGTSEILKELDKSGLFEECWDGFIKEDIINSKLSFKTTCKSFWIQGFIEAIKQEGEFDGK